MSHLYGLCPLSPGQILGTTCRSRMHASQSQKICIQSLRQVRPRILSNTITPFRSSGKATRFISTLPNTSTFRTLTEHDSKQIAVIHSQSGRFFTYGNLVHDVAAVKDVLGHRTGQKSLKGERVAFLAENSYDYVGRKTRNQERRRC